MSGKQISYCSEHCSKLHLKSLYKKRNREKLNTYNRNFRALGVRPIAQPKKIRDEISLLGERCQKSDDLQLHHIRPLRFGGNNEKQNLMVLCRKCHMFWHKCFKSFWEKV